VTPEHVEILETLQRRALTEGRDHLVATVEWAFPGVAPEMADRLIPRVSAAPGEEEDRSDCANPVRGEGGQFEGCEGGEGGGGSEGSGRESSPFDAKPPTRTKPSAAAKNPFDDKPPPRAKAPVATKSPFDEKPPTRGKLTTRGAGVPIPPKRGRDVTEPMPAFNVMSTKEAEKFKDFDKEVARRMEKPEAERIADRERRKKRDSADERADCEKPIRDENGKFNGCEAGEGGGGSSSKSEGKGKESSPFDHRPPAKSKAASSPAPASESPFAAKPPPRAKVSAAKQAEIDEQLQLNRIMNPKMTDEEAETQRASLEQKGASGADRIERLKASGTIKTLPSASADAARAAGDDLRKTAIDSHREMLSLQQKAAAQLNDLRSLNTVDDEPLMKSLGDDRGEFDTIAEADAAFRSYAGEEGESDYASLGSGESKALYSPNGDDDEEDMTPDEIAARKETVKAIKARKGEVQAAAAEAHATFAALHEKQVSAIATLKEKIRAAKDARKSITEDIEDLEPADLVDDKLRAAAEKASEVIDDEDADDDVRAEAQKTVAAYDDAVEAAEEMRDEEINRREEEAGEGLGSLESALSILRSSEKETKSLAGRLAKMSGKKTSTKKAAKSKAADPDDDDDVEEDEPEDDEE
jgi:hypothetical protein